MVRAKLKAAAAPVVSADVYDPLQDQGPFMNPRMLVHFREILRTELEALNGVLAQDRAAAMEVDLQCPDPADRAFAEAESARNQILSRKNIDKRVAIQFALRAIDEGEYGYCDQTGEPIPLARLVKYPWSLRTVEAQGVLDRESRQFRDSDMFHFKI